MTSARITSGTARVDERSARLSALVGLSVAGFHKSDGSSNGYGPMASTAPTSSMATRGRRTSVRSQRKPRSPSRTMAKPAAITKRLPMYGVAAEVRATTWLRS